MTTDKKVLINYMPGAHGHFLEFILNTLDSDDVIPQPFDELGTSIYREYPHFSKRFCGDHYYDGFILSTEKRHFVESSTECIYIDLQADKSDYMLFFEVQFHRAADKTYRNVGHIDDIHVDTFHKFNNRFRKDTLEYFRQYKPSLSENDPDCDAWIVRKWLSKLLREFDTSNRVPYFTDKNLIRFPFLNFYNEHNFSSSIKQLALRYDLKFEEKLDTVLYHYKTFIKKNAFAQRNSYERCQNILSDLDSGEPFEPINLMEQAYICNYIDDNVNMPYNIGNDFFTRPIEIKSFIEKHK